MTNCLLEVTSWFSCIRTVVRCPSSVRQCVRASVCIRIYLFISVLFQSKDYLSAILPRELNLREDGVHYTRKELLVINKNISKINEELKGYSKTVNNVYILEHPQFVSSLGVINEWLLAADGLHLSFEGTEVTVENFVSAIMEVKRASFSLFTSSALGENSVPSEVVRDSGKDDILFFSDVVRYGEAKVQPRLETTTKTQIKTQSKRQKTRKGDVFVGSNRTYVIRKTRRKQQSKMREEATLSKQRFETKPTATRTVQQVAEQCSFLQNRFSVLETQSDSDFSDCSEDDDVTDSYEVTPPKPRKINLVGGCGKKTENENSERGDISDERQSKENGLHKRKSVDRKSSSDSQIPCSDSVNVSLDKTGDLSPEELTETVLSGTSPIRQSSTTAAFDQELQELENKNRDVSVDTESTVCEIVTVKTDIETGNNEIVSEVDTSIDEVIGLLNNKGIEYTGEKQSSENDMTSNVQVEKVKLFQGQTFDTFDDFKTEFDVWCQQNNHPMKTDSSQKSDEGSTSQFPFRQIRYTCKHSGKPRARGNGKRPVQAYLACECPVSLRLVLDAKNKNYKIKKMLDVHNHTTSSGELKHYSTSRRLETNEKEDIKALIDLNVETKNIKSFIREKTGKAVQTKDINNVKLQAVKEKEGGLSKGDLLGNMLKELTVKRQATTLVEVDDTRNVDLVYIQTSEMREQPEISWNSICRYHVQCQHRSVPSVSNDGWRRGWAG